MAVRRPRRNRRSPAELRPADRPVATHGLTHLALAVRDPKSSFAFYRRVLGVRVTYEDDESIEVQTPGRRDAIVFLRRPRTAGRAGGLQHFGFRARRPQDVAAAPEVVRAAGGRVRDQGEFAPGQPYVFFRDPDGYEVELWYE